MFGKINNM